MKKRKSETAAALIALCLVIPLFSCSPDISFICQSAYQDYSPVYSDCPSKLDFSLKVMKPEILDAKIGTEQKQQMQDFLFEILNKEIDYCAPASSSSAGKTFEVKAEVTQLRYEAGDPAAFPSYAKVRIIVYNEGSIAFDKVYEKETAGIKNEREALSELAQAMLEIRNDILKAAAEIK